METAKPARNSGFSYLKDRFTGLQARRANLHRIIYAEPGEGEREAVITYRTARGAVRKCLITLRHDRYAADDSIGRTLRYWNQIVAECSRCEVSFRFSECKATGEVLHVGYDARPV